ncbi:MAG: hypothetical protein H6602_01375 [Flavobacteriales bacterium]|nr:hypothetical protein [Flavobacteriales bacterium]
MVKDGIHNQTFRSMVDQAIRSPVSMLELKARLEEKPYRAVDTGIHPKVMADWNRHELLLVKPEPNKMHRFSITEFVWVKLIEKMRQYGFPLKVIKAFKEDMDSSIVEQVSSEFTTSFFFENLKGMPGMDDHEKLKRYLAQADPNEMARQFLPQYGLDGNVLELLVVFCLFLKTPFSFFIDHEGKGTYFSPLMLKEGLYSQDDISELFTQSFVSISLSEVLSEVFLLSDIDILHGQLMVLSDMEANVLEALREDDLSSVMIRYDKDNQMDLMEIKKLQKTEREARLMDLMLKGGYQDITVKTQHGKVVYCETTRKVKLK